MSSTDSDRTASLTDTASSIASSLVSSAISTALSASESLTRAATGSITDAPSSAIASTTAEAEPTSSNVVDTQPGRGQDDQGIGIVSFLTAVGVALAVFAVQLLLFLVLRNKLARIL